MSPTYSWSLNPGALLLIAGLGAVYLRRWRTVRRETGPRAASVWRLAYFAAGLVAMFAALISPIDALGEQLFVMHMVQHLLLADIAAVLLLLGLTKVMLRPLTGLLAPFERRSRVLAHPAFAVLLYVATFWVWHIPAMYQLGLEHPALHPIQHMSFASAALIFWWHLLSPIRSRRYLAGMGVVFYLAAAKLINGILASILTFSPVFLYDFYARQPRYWGLTAAEDQTLAGATMMIEESLIITAAMVVLFLRMLSESERDQLREERFGLGDDDRAL